MSAPLLAPAAASLVRQLTRRSGARPEDVLVSNGRSVDWHSLTFEGQRHVVALHLTGSDAETAAERMINGLADHEFQLPGAIVADIVATIEPSRGTDGAVAILVEALTLRSN